MFSLSVTCAALHRFCTFFPRCCRKPQDLLVPPHSTCACSSVTAAFAVTGSCTLFRKARLRAPLDGDCVLHLLSGSSGNRSLSRERQDWARRSRGGKLVPGSVITCSVHSHPLFQGWHWVVSVTCWKLLLLSLPILPYSSFPLFFPPFFFFSPGDSFQVIISHTISGMAL